MTFKRISSVHSRAYFKKINLDCTKSKVPWAFSPKVRWNDPLKWFTLWMMNIYKSLAISRRFAGVNSNATCLPCFTKGMHHKMEMAKSHKEYITAYQASIGGSD